MYTLYIDNYYTLHCQCTVVVPSLYSPPSPPVSGSVSPSERLSTATSPSANPSFTAPALSLRSSCHRDRQSLLWYGLLPRRFGLSSSPQASSNYFKISSPLSALSYSGTCIHCQSNNIGIVHVHVHACIHIHVCTTHNDQKYIVKLVLLVVVYKVRVFEGPFTGLYFKYGHSLVTI